MMLQERITLHFNESLQTLQDTLAGLGETIGFASQKLVTAILNDNKILVCGNGACAANAGQFSAAMLNRLERERPALPAIALTADTAVITSIAADYHFDDIFAKQVKALGQSEDILLVFSSNGNPANILKAVTAAHDKNISVIALTGHDGGMLAPILNTSDIEIRVPSSNDSRIRETHLLISHCLCDLIDHQIFGSL
ncbi:SIS domain-containing protein [Methylotuvimicrobium alcaliphilum]|uniref:SIS domain-containing protein n=1 Tax=Methylotuvimicrobium alcaliphilum TaxID=271065 RepID=UPI0005FC28AC|nr:SIS domain-containing protein [Methylotuvimicrobium alcaliphilum]